LEGEEMPVHVEGFAGGDRTDIVLPAAQEKLVEAAAATGKPLVVVLMNGSALAVNWAQQHASAILEAWYPGESAGAAIAETLAGKNNPGGKLPVTFYRSVNDLPPFDDYSMKNRTYRYFTGKPLYGFGYGLSYTHFQFGAIALSSAHIRAGQPLDVHAQLTNTGTVAGDEVAELYLAPTDKSISPSIALIGFERLHLSPGEQKDVSFHLTPRQLSTVDAEGKRRVTQGNYTLYLGSAQPTEAQDASAKFAIEGTQVLPR
jgi:beta-glucosidase